MNTSKAALLIGVCWSLMVCLAHASSPLVWEQMERDVTPERHTASLPEWTRVSRADASEKLQLTFAVKQTHQKELEDLLLRVSDPRSTEYGRHWSKQQVDELVAPTAESIQAVLNYLQQQLHTDLAGLESQHQLWMSDSKDFIRLLVTVAQAEQMLHTEFFLFVNNHTASVSAVEATAAAVAAGVGEAASSPLVRALTRTKPVTAVRCYSYSLPSGVSQHVDFVAPTIRLPKTQRRRITAPNDLFVVPAFLRSLYNVGTATGVSSSNAQGVASFLEQYFSPDDLQTFFKLFQNTSVGHTVSKLVGDNDATNPGTEAELDVQYIMSVGENVNTWVFYTAGRSPTNPDNEPFLTWLMNVSAIESPPNVFSVSYGDAEQSVGYDYASRINAEFQELGTRGISIMFASGDDGTGGNCTSSGRFSPDFPSGSPWVTAVGGVTGGTVGASPTGEIVDSISGGGFSDWWPRPSYQDAAVTEYLSNTTGLPDPNDYNHTGRGYPDVAAQSEGFVVVQFGIPLPGVGGTSCASPTFSGVISLLNDLRLQNNKSPLGFLNPLIYQVGANPKWAGAFNDITYGANFGCDSFAFPARVGWDPASGWGSPNYEVLSQVVMSLP